LASRRGFEPRLPPLRGSVLSH